MIVAENPFSQWVRRHPELDSGDGFSTSDLDIVWHKFRTERGRDFQLLMIIEVKTMGGKISLAQRDTLIQLDQLVRNRRATPTKPKEKNPLQSGTGPHKTFSTMVKRNIAIKAFGVHLLRFSHTNPRDSEWIDWDYRKITEDQLIQILTFDLDPDTLRPMDWRSHHKQRELPLESLMEIGY